jgi:hypothetical protein
MEYILYIERADIQSTPRETDVLKYMLRSRTSVSRDALRMCMCIYIYTHTHMCVCIYIYTHTEIIL